MQKVRISSQCKAEDFTACLQGLKIIIMEQKLIFFPFILFKEFDI